VEAGGLSYQLDRGLLERSQGTIGTQEVSCCLHYHTIVVLYAIVIIMHQESHLGTQKPTRLGQTRHVERRLVDEEC
jgi:hypothetical protein